MNQTITRHEAASLFYFDGKNLINKTDRGVSSPVGSVADCNKSTGYMRVHVRGKEYPSHRLIWLIAKGDWVVELDHINGNKRDNRIENLRPVSRSENLRNSKRSKRNTSGVTGVYWDKGVNKWKAMIHINGRLKTIGRFKSFDECVEARKKAEKENGYHENHGRVA